MFKTIKKLVKNFFIGPTIKGNIRYNGDKVYHVPGGHLYKYVKAEVMFYTEEEAQKAGFRKSKR